MFSVRLILVAAVMAVLLTGTTALATPQVQLRFIETDLKNGSWQYQYALSNLGDPSADIGFNVWDAMITFAPGATFTKLGTPIGWDATTGGGFCEIISTIPGIPADGGFDLGPGEVLSGLSFLLDYRAGSLPFDAYLTNPNDPDGFSLQYTGSTVPDTTPVPEPSSFLLAGAGMATLLLLRRKQH